MRCVGNVEPRAIENQPAMAAITDLVEQQNAYELVSRIYPYGGGTGSERATLADCTRTAPTGYTLNKTANYLERDAAITALGRIDKRIDYPDIVAESQSAGQKQFTANMLFERCYAYLRRHSCTNTDPIEGDVPRTYELGLAKCEKALLPGYTVRVEFNAFNSQGRYIHVDSDLWILSSTVRVSENGVQTVALQCSTTDVAPRTDMQLIADMYTRQRAMAAYAPG